MTGISRRSALSIVALTGVTATLAACTPTATTPAPTPTPTPTPTKSTTPTPEPLGDTQWAALAAALTGTLVRAGDPTYDSVKLTQNPRFDAARPLAVLQATSTADVAAAVTFAARYSLPLAVRSGGHSYPGYSAGGAAGTGVSPSLVVDLRALSAISLAPDNTVRIGAGASLAEVYDTIGSKNRAIAGGSCATVGISGLTLGGGVGVLVREFGLTCDSLVEIEIVTADARVHTASLNSDSDLFWASRGGGGGHLGIVTALTFVTRAAPIVTMFSLAWNYSDAVAVISAWQRFAPHADSKLWSTLKILTGKNYGKSPGVFLSGTWLGDPAALTSQLAPLLAGVGVPTKNSSITHTYRDAMMGYAGCAKIPVQKCATAEGGSLTRQSFAATSHVAYSVLDDSGIRSMLAAVEAGKSVPGIIEGGVSMDALGGAVSDIAVGATAFAHRAALMTVQYTATCADDTATAPLESWVRGVRSAMVSHWGNAAYVNYADSAIPNSSTAYFADNSARLAQIAQRYDPNGLFTQPQPW